MKKLNLVSLTVLNFIKSGTEGGYVLKWNNYLTWGGGVKYYTLFKKESSDITWTVESVLSSNTFFLQGQFRCR